MMSVVVILTAVMVYTCQAANLLHPVILVPGNGGNQLEAKLTGSYVPSSLACYRWYPVVTTTKAKAKDGWFRLWFDPSVLLAPFTKCFADRMTLCYDPLRDDYFNAPGVQTRVPHFGSVRSLLYLDPHLKIITSYMAPLVESLEEVGYRDGETLFGAPYDFRYGLAPQGHPHAVGSKFLSDLKALIESAFRSNGDRPAIIIAHSLGCLFALNLLLRNSPNWRQKHVAHLVALSPPWGGTVEEMLTFASGTTLGVPIVDPLLVRAEQRSSESNLWLMPNSIVFPPHQVLVSTPDRNYTANNIPRFLEDIGLSDGVKPYVKRVIPMMEAVSAPPGVAVTVVMGSGVDTPERLIYGPGGFDKRPDIVYGDGDGTVNRASLSAAELIWGDRAAVKLVELPGVSHTGVLSDETSLREIVGEISTLNSHLSFAKVS